MAQRKFPDWATLDIPDIGNGDPNKADPGQAKQDSGWSAEKPLLQTMNWLQNLQSHFIRANNEFALKADLYEAEAGEIVIMDNSIGTVTGKLPATPIDGQWVVFQGVELYSVNPVVVDGNGNDIMVATDTTCTLDIDDGLFIFRWDATNNLWKINIYGSTGRIR